MPKTRNYRKSRKIKKSRKRYKSRLRGGTDQVKPLLHLAARNKIGIIGKYDEANLTSDGVEDDISIRSITYRKSWMSSVTNTIDNEHYTFVCNENVIATPLVNGLDIVKISYGHIEEVEKEPNGAKYNRKNYTFVKPKP